MQAKELTHSWIWTLSDSGLQWSCDPQLSATWLSLRKEPWKRVTAITMLVKDHIAGGGHYADNAWLSSMVECELFKVLDDNMETIWPIEFKLLLSSSQAWSGHREQEIKWVFWFALNSSRLNSGRVTVPVTSLPPKRIRPMSGTKPIVANMFEEKFSFEQQLFMFCAFEVTVFGSSSVLLNKPAALYSVVHAMPANVKKNCRVTDFFHGFPPLETRCQVPLNDLGAKALGDQCGQTFGLS